MRIIEGVLFEPVGCLAEFPADEFNEIAARLFGRRKSASKSGSRSYWHLLNLIQAADRKLDASARKILETLEVQAVDGASSYDDVMPALSELKAMGIKQVVTSSLSQMAVMRFLEKFVLNDFFSEVWNRDNAGGIKAFPLASAIDSASFKPEQVMFLTDTAEGLKVSKAVGVNSILMMNDPAEAMRLAMHDPAGGIVSLHELPDFIRLVAAENARLPHP
ncbi:MAG: hypothetical protein DMG13_28895 [Acidobacteria bacterium]|nr:MAG: hypothetical protein DMG13_28895 [Acidobacteriota bacterium]